MGAFKQKVIKLLADAQKTHAIAMLNNAPVGVNLELVLRESVKKRNNDQNALMWSRLHDISKQIKWPVDGTVQYLSEDEWKDILTAGLKKHQRIAQGVDGGFVILGVRTSKMKVAEMVELIEFIQYFGDETGVVWSKDGAE